jgi:hypothetical protein
LMRFEILGPKGNWQLKSSRGVEHISKGSGNFPDSITAVKIKDTRTDILIELEYKGEESTSVFGERMAKNKPVIFRFQQFFQPIDWEVRFFDLDTTVHHPVKTGTIFSGTNEPAAFRVEKKDRLDYAWWGGIKEAGISHPRFICLAVGKAFFEPGEYELGVTWDDAVRVYLDDRLLLNEWEPSKYLFDESPHKKLRVKLGGLHRFRVEHLELGGFACLALKIKPVIK